MSKREVVAKLLKTRRVQSLIGLYLLALIGFVMMGVPLLVVLFFPIAACITLWLALTIPKRR